HADTDVRKSLPYVCCGRARRGRYDRDQRSPYRIADVKTEPKCKQGNEDEATAESGERTDQAGADPAEHYRPGDMQLGHTSKTTIASLAIMCQDVNRIQLQLDSFASWAIGQLTSRRIAADIHRLFRADGRR